MGNHNGEGHQLEEITAVVAYKCKNQGCDWYIRVENISRGSIGRYCPRCDASGDKRIKAEFSGSEHVKYSCLNCGHSWRQLM